MRRKDMRSFLKGVVMSALLASAAPAETYKGYEMPPFQVVAEAPGYQLRDYQPHVLATVTVDGSLRSSASRGFRALAGYIFGGNAAGEKIAMTVPVGQVPSGDGYEISFMMPAKYDLDALPVPSKGDILFSETTPERIAVSRFSGYATEAVLRREAAKLRDALKRDGLKVVEGPRYAYYDDPFTMPWRRQNEVMFVVKK